MARRVFSLATAAAVALALAGSAEAAAPRLIIVTGEPLAQPILVSDAEEVFELYGSFFEGPSIDRASLVGRPFLRLALFWDNRLWEPYVREGRLDELRPDQANQVGRFYPAVGREPALVDVPGHGQWPKRATAEALRIFEAARVPVRLEEKGVNRVPWIAGGLTGACAAFAVALFVFARRRAARSTIPRP